MQLPFILGGGGGGGGGVSMLDVTNYVNSNTYTRSAVDGFVNAMFAAANAARTGISPAQGLTFLGGNTAATATLPAALGTSDASIECVFDVPTVAPATNQIIFQLATARAEGQANELVFTLRPSGEFWVYKRGSLVGDWRAAVVVGFVSTYAGKRVKLVVTRSGNTLAIYANGAAIGFSELTAGTPPAWSVTWDGTLLTIGRQGDNYTFNGYIGPIRIFNRLLSPAQVLALYETGSPEAMDYVGPVGAGLITGDASTFATDNAFWVKGVGTTISGGKANFTSDSILQKTNFLTVGRRYRATFTVSGYTAGAANLNNGAFVVYQNVTANGTYTVDFTAQVTSTFQFSTGTGVTWSVDDVTLVPLGVIFAPEVNAPGNGYVWRDSSGNKADVLLPTSGVSWTLPDSLPNNVRGTTATNGNQLLNGSTTILQAGTQITRVRAKARSGTPTVSIGTSSGGAQIAASTVLGTAWKDLTIALADGLVSTNSAVWVASNSTATIDLLISTEPLDS